MSKGSLFIISGASGVGKSTVLKKVMEARKDLLFSVSATTRPMRNDDIADVTYHFITEEQFDEMVRNDEFLEYNRHAKASYGTPRRQMEEKLAVANVILDVEPNGAFAVRKHRPDATLIFIMPPSEEILEFRLRNRQNTSEEQIQIRLDRAKWEMAQRFEYDHVVVNDDLDTCVNEILKLIAEKAD